MILLVGGPKSGERVCLPDDMLVYTVTVCMPLMLGNFVLTGTSMPSDHTYIRKTLQIADTPPKEMFVHSEIANNEKQIIEEIARLLTTHWLNGDIVL